MNIKEATKKAMKEQAFITRQKDYSLGDYRIGIIKPSNTHDTCAIMTIDAKGNLSNYCRNWNPTADDLMADDWEVVKIGKEGLLPT